MIIYYYSGTGNSYWTAKQLSEHFDAELCSIMDANRAGRAEISADCIGIVCPTYLNGLPVAVQRFLYHADITKLSYVFLVMTSNHGENKSGFQQAAALLHEKGAELSYAADLQMPGNYLVSTPEQDRERLHLAPAAVQAICSDIEQRRCNYTAKVKAAKKPAEQPTRLYRLMARMTVTEQCDGCGLCEKICPINNICMENGKALHGASCECCFACIHWCPKYATVKKYPKNFRQYHHPEAKLTELFSLSKKNSTS